MIERDSYTNINTNDIKFSILIPVYNKENFLEKCLKSIMNQNYKNFECVIIDDGSTDKSLSIIREYTFKDSRFVVYTQRNQGVASTRQKLLNYIRGDYVLWIDPDDWVDQCLLEVLREEIERDMADCYIFPYMIYSNGVYIKKDLLRAGKFDKIELFKELALEISMPSFLWNKVIRREKYRNLKFCPDFDIFEDYMIMHHLLYKCNKFYYINRPMYFYRKHEDSLTSTFSESDFSKLLYCINERKEFILLRYPTLKYAINAGHCYMAFINLVYHNIDNNYIKNKLRGVIKKNILYLLVNNKYKGIIKFKVMMIMVGVNFYKFFSWMVKKIKELNGVIK